MFWNIICSSNRNSSMVFGRLVNKSMSFIYAVMGWATTILFWITLERITRK